MRLICRKILLIFVLVLFLNIFFPMVANGEEREVKPENGLSNGNIKFETPCGLPIVSSDFDKVVSHCFGENNTTGFGVRYFYNIQDAVDTAVEKDKIYILSGTYYENVIINKSIILEGEYDLYKIEKNKTTIDGNYTSSVIIVSAANVTIQKLTIQHSGTDSDTAGINIYSNNCTIKQNIIKNHIIDNSWDGVYLKNSKDVVIYCNSIENCGDDGMGIDSSDNITIDNNSILNSFENGIYLYSSKTSIFQNTINQNKDSGIFLRNSDNSNMQNNIFTQNQNGISITYESSKNNIIDNEFNKNTNGIYLSKDAGNNDISNKNNDFSDNRKNIFSEKEQNNSPDFEITTIIFTIIFFILFRRKNL